MPGPIEIDEAGCRVEHDMEVLLVEGEIGIAKSGKNIGMAIRVSEKVELEAGQVMVLGLSLDDWRVWRDNITARILKDGGES